MLDYLYDVEDRIHELLSHPELWNDLLVTYEKPTVERLWMQDGENRIYLHRIHTCNPGEAYYHKHPWPSAMRVVSGTYEMQVGLMMPGNTEPTTAAKLRLDHGSTYEMTNSEAMHSVRPLAYETLSLMVTGPRWTISDSAAKLDNGRLTQDQRDRLFADFLDYYLW